MLSYADKSTIIKAGKDISVFMRAQGTCMKEVNKYTEPQQGVYEIWYEVYI